MGALALVFPFLVGVGLTETTAWALGFGVYWVLVALVSAGLSLLGVALGLWVRSCYQSKKEPPGLSLLALGFGLLLLLGGLGPLMLLRALGWSLALWLGLRWLPKAIWQIGSMC